MKINFRKTRRGFRANIPGIPIIGFGSSKVEALHSVLIALPEAVSVWDAEVDYKTLENQESLRYYHQMKDLLEGFSDSEESFASYRLPNIEED